MPIEPVVRAFLAEEDRVARRGMERLLRAILKAKAKEGPSGEQDL